MNRQEELELKIKSLRAKREEFWNNGDMSNANTCNIIADFLEDTLRDAELRAASGAPLLNNYLTTTEVDHI